MSDELFSGASVADRSGLVGPSTDLAMDSNFSLPFFVYPIVGTFVCGILVVALVAVVLIRYRRSTRERFAVNDHVYETTTRTGQPDHIYAIPIRTGLFNKPGLALSKTSDVLAFVNPGYVNHIYDDASLHENSNIDATDELHENSQNISKITIKR